LFLSNRAAVRQFLSQGGGGSVLNMSSSSVFRRPPGISARTLICRESRRDWPDEIRRARYASDGIRFNVLAPPLVATPMSQRAQDLEIRNLRFKTALDGGRIGSLRFGCAAVYFLSDGSRFATGQFLAVDAAGASATAGLKSRSTPPRVGLVSRASR